MTGASGAIIGILIGLSGLGIAFLQLKYVKIKKPRYDILSVPIITESISNVPGLEIFIDGQSVRGITKVIFKFWNAGKEPIRLHDSANDYMVSLVFRKRVNLFYSSEIELSDPGVKHSVEISENELRVKVDYLDRGEALQVLFYVDTAEVPKIYGKILGAEAIIRSHVLGIRDDVDKDEFDVRSWAIKNRIAVSSALFIFAFVVLVARLLQVGLSNEPYILYIMGSGALGMGLLVLFGVRAMQVPTKSVTKIK